MAVRDPPKYHCNQPAYYLGLKEAVAYTGIVNDPTLNIHT